MKPLDERLTKVISGAIKSFLDVGLKDTKNRSVTYKNITGASLFISSQVTGFLKDVEIKSLTSNTIRPMLVEDYEHLITRHEKSGGQIKYLKDRVTELELQVKELQSELAEIDIDSVGK